jgi:hypothetical protein
MKAPAFVLIVSVAVCVLARASVALTVIVPVLISCLAAELDRAGGSIGVAITQVAVILLPAAERSHYADAWNDHVRSVGSHGLRPVASALSIALLAAPLLAVLTRFDRGRMTGSRTSHAAASARVSVQIDAAIRTPPVSETHRKGTQTERD